VPPPVLAVGDSPGDSFKVARNVAADVARSSSGALRDDFYLEIPGPWLPGRPIVTRIVAAFAAELGIEPDRHQ